MVSQLLAMRKGKMSKMIHAGSSRVRLEFAVPSRGLIGFRSRFLTDTRGTGIMNALFNGWAPWHGAIQSRINGAMVADREGPATPYAVFHLQERGVLFHEVEEVLLGLRREAPLLLLLGGLGPPGQGPPEVIHLALEVGFPLLLAQPLLGEGQGWRALVAVHPQVHEGVAGVDQALHRFEAHLRQHALDAQRHADRGDELRNDDVRAEAAADLPEWRLRDARHRRQDERHVGCGPIRQVHAQQRNGGLRGGQRIITLRARPPIGRAAVQLREFFSEDAISLDLKANTKDEALKELAGLLKLDEKSSAMLFKMLKRRETLGSTGVGQGMAIPHCRSLVVNRLRVAFGRKLAGIDFKAIDSRPVHYFFLIVAPPLEVSNQYLPVLGKLAQFAKEPDVPERLAKLEAKPAAKRTPKSDLDGKQLAHDLSGVFLAYHQAARLMKDPRASARAEAAFEALVRAARLSGAPASRRRRR